LPRAVRGGLVVADQQRADEPGPVALAWLPPGHDDLLAAEVLDLPPAAGPGPGLVQRVEPLDHYAFEPVGNGGGQDGLHVPAGERGRGEPAASVRHDALEYFPAFDVR